jgi:hypothetical protein
VVLEILLALALLASTCTGLVLVKRYRARKRAAEFEARRAGRNTLRTYRL